MANDTEISYGNAVAAWTSDEWLQTFESDFERGMVQDSDIIASPGDILLAVTTDFATDSYENSDFIAQEENVSIDANTGVVKLSDEPISLSVTLQPPDAATYVNSLSSTSNYGSSSSIYVSSSDKETQRSLIAFNLSDLPSNVHITSAVLSLYASSSFSTDEPIGVHRITSEWSSDTVTWSTVEGNFEDNETDMKTLVWNGEPQWENWDVTSDVLNFVSGVYPNYGWLIKGEEESGEEDTSWEFCGSMCSTPNFAPMLVIYYDSENQATTGTLTSTDLLKGKQLLNIKQFNYEASVIPSDAALSVQFSVDGENWFDANGVEDEWTPCLEGSQTIDLSSLNLSDSSFYYKMHFDTSNGQSPQLDEVSVAYTHYTSNGAYYSPVFDTFYNGSRTDAIFWDISLPEGTNVVMEMKSSNELFLKDDNILTWTTIDTLTGCSSSLPAGRYKQWRVILVTSNMSQTPIVREVRVYYH
ncbi:DNRLRE domain-containing protein [Coprothermobacter platensis]|uniref:DNRLRE domain-containing protein n=1 Tax=Coprothermobacter platensis TaxID=108819 RepID=UPI0014613AE2|nr:DNRLRE domain-containing protein [Coprothermobacter platensis]